MPKLNEVNEMFVWVSSASNVAMEETFACTAAWSQRLAEKALGKNRAKHFGKVLPVAVTVTVRETA